MTYCRTHCGTHYTDIIVRDFTLDAYKALLVALQKAEYRFLTFAAYKEKPQAGKMVILRHDVDKSPAKSLQTARLENELGIRGSYYFRAVSQSWDENVIRQIADLGHEVGYHYENLTTCKGDVDKAYNDFNANLQRLRKLTSVQTICMHGSPTSPYDSRDIWKTYSYKESGIIGEPYLDTDFADVFYLTDTGRRWDGDKVSVRDKVDGPRQGELTFHTTQDIIHAVECGQLPKHLMITVHPQRWNDALWAWTIELVAQSVKNRIKQLLLFVRRKQNNT